MIIIGLPSVAVSLIMIIRQVSFAESLSCYMMIIGEFSIAVSLMMMMFIEEISVAVSLPC